MTAATSDDAVTDSSTAPWLVAGASAAAGIIHFSVVSEHSAGDVIVPLGFAITAIAQVAVAVALVAKRSSRAAMWAAVAVNLAATGAWAWSRTIGLPWQPYDGVPEQAGTLDLTCAGLQAAAITIGIGLLIAPRIKIPAAASAAVAIGAIALAAVVVVTPESAPTGTTVAASTGGAAAAPAAAGGDGHGHSHGGSAATPAASGDMAAEMLRIDRARCDLAFNPQAYWDEAYAMNIDTYGGGSMAMPAPSTLSDVAGAQLLDGAGSAQLDTMISLTSVSSGEGAAAQLIGELADATDDEYEAWRRWVAANPGGHGDPVKDASGNVTAQPANMGHPGPTPWKAMVDTAQCDRLADELAQARAVTERYATVADATEAGYFKVTGYVPGIAAHYMNFGLVDSEFHLDEPEMLLFDGTDPESRIVGLSYYVRLDGTAEPTQGFVGDNDTYHRHFGLCIGAGGVIGDSTTTEEECASRGGRKSNGVDGWMSHAWVVPGCESPWGVFSGENPLLTSTMGEASGDPDSGGCAASEVRDRYDLSAGESDLSVTAPTDEASGR